MIMLAALLLATSPAPLPERPLAAPMPDSHLASLADSFVELCLEGNPTPAQAEARAQEAGWVHAPGSGDADGRGAKPAGARPVVMTKSGQILILMPPHGATASRMCEVGLNFPRNITLEELAADMSVRLQLGPYRLKQVGPTLFALWERSPDLELRAAVPSDDGPRTHILMALMPPVTDGR